MADTLIAQREDNPELLAHVVVSVSWANERNRREIVLRSVDEIDEVPREG